MDKALMRAARSLLGWSQEELSIRSGVSVTTVRRIEPGDGSVKVNKEVLDNIRQAFTDAGVIFIENNAKSDGGGIGVRLELRGKKSRYGFVREKLDEADQAVKRAVDATKEIELADQLFGVRDAIRTAAQFVDDELSKLDR